jgi:hypothetical protein
MPKAVPVIDGPKTGESDDLISEFVVEEAGPVHLRRLQILPMLSSIGWACNQQVRDSVVTMDLSPSISPHWPRQPSIRMQGTHTVVSRKRSKKG